MPTSSPRPLGIVSDRKRNSGTLWRVGWKKRRSAYGSPKKNCDVEKKKMFREDVKTLQTVSYIYNIPEAYQNKRGPSDTYRGEILVTQ